MEFFQNGKAPQPLLEQIHRQKNRLFQFGIIKGIGMEFIKKRGYIFKKISAVTLIPSKKLEISNFSKTFISNTGLSIGTI